MSRGQGNSLLAALLWVSATLLVALPVPLWNLDWPTASQKLLTELHAMFICCLIVVDVIIGARYLGDDRISDAYRQNGLKIAGVIIVPLVVFGGIWRANPATLWTWISYVGLVVVLILIAIRFWTYHRTLQVTPVSTPTVTDE